MAPVQKKSERNRKLYIILSYSGTAPAKLIKLWTREPYSHASIAFEEDLSEMYSFARKGIWNPFNAGFIREDIHTGIFGKKENTKCNIYCIKVTEEQYLAVRKEIEKFKSMQDVFSYNYLGIWYAAINKSVPRKNKYFCSQFVAEVLKRSGINIFFKNSDLVRPRDIRLNPWLKTVYKGKLTDYERKVILRARKAT